MTKKPYDIDFDNTRAALERVMRALLIVQGHFTDSMALAPIDVPSRAVIVFLRVQIPNGKEAEFEALAKVKLNDPPRVHLNKEPG